MSQLVFTVCAANRDMYPYVAAAAAMTITVTPHGASVDWQAGPAGAFELRPGDKIEITAAKADA